jgi:NTE family protein
MKKEKIALALQGGGSHGAFTWGVMEKLLEEEVLDIRGFCGTSVGAINSAMIVHGFQKNGHQGAIELLGKFWKEISQVSAFVMPQGNWIDNNLFNGNLDFSFAYQTFNYLGNYFSPYQFNPLNINPLKSILLKLIDFEELKKSDIKLFVAATNVKKGCCKVFSLSEISVNALLASACLPYLSQAIEIDGEFYWDGGYSGNPPIYPLIYGTDSKDILLIQINPIWSKNLPKEVSEIADRMNEISFNASLKAEMRMITMGYELEGALKNVYFQLIQSDGVLDDLNFSSKINTSWEFLNRLRKLGRQSAEKWITNEMKFVGKKSSDLIKEMFGYVEEDWFYEMVKKPAQHLKAHPIKNESEKNAKKTTEKIISPIHKN